MPRRAPISTWSRGGKPRAVGAPQVRTVTLAEGSRPTGTLACGRFGSARSSGPSSSSTARRTASCTRSRSERSRAAAIRLSCSTPCRRAISAEARFCSARSASMCCSNSRRRLSTSRMWSTSDTSAPRTRRASRTTSGCCRISLMSSIVSSANTKIKQIGPRLDVENYTRRPPAILTDLDQVIGGGLDIHPEAVALGIDGLARKDGAQARRRDLLDDEGRRDEAVAVEDDEQVVQPGHEQTFQVVGLYGARPALTLLHRGGIDDEVKHAAGGVGEEFGKIAAVSDDADIGGMVKDLEGDRGRRHERGAGAIIARAARKVLE